VMRAPAPPSRPDCPKAPSLSAVRSGWVKCSTRAGFPVEPARAVSDAIAGSDRAVPRSLNRRGQRQIHDGGARFV